MKLPAFDIYATGTRKFIHMNGVELTGVTDIEVHMNVGEPARVVISFIAGSVNDTTEALRHALEEKP